MADTLDMWTIYDSPRDHPEGLIARRFEIGRGAEPRATQDTLTAATLMALREKLRAKGMVAPLPRYPGDDPHIVETWI